MTVPQQSTNQGGILAGAFVVAMFIGGLILAGKIMPLLTFGIDPFWRYVGWGCVVLALLRWRTVFEGIRRSGQLLFFLVIVAAFAFVFGGEDGLWNTFF